MVIGGKTIHQRGPDLSKIWILWAVAFLVIFFAYTDNLRAFEFPSEAAKSLELSCQSSYCESGIGSLLVHNNNHSEDNLELCTFSMLSADTALTNFHCLPKRIRKSGASCSGALEFIFYSSQAKDSKIYADCDYVESFSREDLNSIKRTGPYISSLDLTRDYAVLRLKNFKASRFFNVSQEGVDDNQSLKLIKSTPLQTKETIRVQLQEQDCRVVYAPDFLFTFQHSKSPFVALNDCTSTEGNSGSVFLNSKNNIVSLLITHRSSYLANDNVKSIYKKSTTFTKDYQFKSSKSHYVLSTNASCLDIPRLQIMSKHKDCYLNSENKNALWNQYQHHKFSSIDAEQMLNNEIRNIENEQQLFDWQYLDLDSRDFPEGPYIVMKVWTPRPICISKKFQAKQNLKNFFSLHELNPWLNMKFKTYKFAQISEYDSDLRLHIRIISSPIELEYQMNLVEVKKALEDPLNSSINFKIKYSDNSDQFIGNIEFCSE